MKRRRGGRPGFSLVEGIVSVLLLGMIAMSVVGIFPSEYRSIKRSHRALIATSLCEQLLETIRAQPYDAVAPGRFDGAVSSPLGGFPPGPYPTATVTNTANGMDDTQTYTFEVSVTEVAAPSPHKKLVVRAAWKEVSRGGTMAGQTVSLASLLTP